MGQSIPRVHQKGTKAVQGKLQLILRCVLLDIRIEACTIGTGPQRLDVQGDISQALPKRRRVTFKEEVLILTDSAREFTKLNLRHGSTRKRFKDASRRHAGPTSDALD